MLLLELMTARMGKGDLVPLLVEWARMVMTEIVALTFCALCEPGRNISSPKKIFLIR